MTTTVPPLQLGYRWPAEWEPHAGTWLAWPHNQDTWPGRYPKIASQFDRFVRDIAAAEPVHILAGSGRVFAEAESWVGKLNNVCLHDIPTNDAWIRDYGPMFLQSTTNQPPALVDWKYNAWGGRYPPFADDNRVPFEIAMSLGYRRFTCSLVLEGGSIDGNGRGTVLTTDSCLLNSNRNPSLTRADVEEPLKQYCGATKVIWLDGELTGDDTDGHVDQIARFVDSKTVVVAQESDSADENYHSLRQCYQQLVDASDQNGNSLNVIPLPLPAPRFAHGVGRLPASYTNFYITNESVLVPGFGDTNDERARSILKDICPNREIISCPSEDLVVGLGSFHCLSQQQPREIERPEGE